MMGAFLMEENDRWAAKHKIYYKPAVKALKEKVPALERIAKLQRQLAKAA